MQPYGSDRVRIAGGKVLLHSAIPKGWTARVPQQGTHAPHPGTTVLWDEQYFEVIAAEPAAGGGVRYVLAAWPDEHAIRVFEHYDAEAESARIADYEAALAQRKGSVLASLSSVVLGHLPAPVQTRLGNEYGIEPSRMTIVSVIPVLILFGACFWLSADARLKQAAPPIPVWLWIVTFGLMLESAVRFFVGLTQKRPMGSVLGFIGYSAFWLLAPHRARLLSPLQDDRGSALFTIAPTEDVELRDAIETRSAFFSLLTPAEQQRLAERFGYEYQRHAKGLAIVILVFSLLGACTSLMKLLDGPNGSALLSLIVAGALAMEQIVRLRVLPHRPAGSVLGALVRPLVRPYLG
ncbi:MAG TPA: hypothetical protein VHL59_13695 [Thermoanaerobaculia bacterium]|nr:hypothetical protein [Thermoanaerobaculia bacterium]